MPSGLSAFAYISLGTQFSYVTKSPGSQNIVIGKDGKPVNPYINYDEVLLNSLPFD